MKRLRFEQVRLPSYFRRRIIKRLLSLSCPGQLSDTTLIGLTILRGRIPVRLDTSKNPNQPVVVPDEVQPVAKRLTPNKSLLDPVDDMLCRIDPITWYRRMTLCAGKILRSQKDSVQALVARTDLIKEELERPHPSYDWPTSTPQQRAYLTEGVLTNEVPIVLDTGASFSLTPFESDFVRGLTPSKATEMTGITDAVKIEGIGTVEWPIVDIFGRCRTITTQAYYVPQAGIRLFSPQVYFQDEGKGRCVVTDYNVTLTLSDDSELQFPYHQSSNLPFMLLQHGPSKEAGLSLAHFRLLDETITEPNEVDINLTLLDKHNTNLAANQKELLLWHWQLMHAGQDWVQTLMATPKQEVGDRPPAPIVPTKTSRVSNCSHPVCPACQLGKQHRRTPGHVQVQADPDHEMAIRRENLMPG
jgi:hypothetical protein